MTIIGKPPTPRTGCTFADRDPGHLFVLRGENYLKESATTARLLCRGARSETIAGDTQVLPVLMTPAEPKPDPAVTTYGELEPRQWFYFVPGEHVWYLDGNTCPVAVGARRFDPSAIRDTDPVRVLTPLELAEHFATLAGAHVVVPEAPGTYCYLLKGEPHLASSGDERWAWLEHAVRQGATLLAQRDASLESEPDVEPRIADGVGGRPLGDSELRSPAEDRSKPAPGFPLDVYDISRYRVRTGPGTYSHPDDQSHGGAVAHSWELHDAEQARKAGEL